LQSGREAVLIKGVAHASKKRHNLSMEEEITIFDLLATLNARSGWLIFFVFGIWVGLIIVNYNLMRIFSQLQILNQRNRGNNDEYLPPPKKPYIPEEVSAGKGPFKYCEACSSPTAMHKMECQTCHGTLFFQKNPDTKK